jgi:molybdate transport system substrate-binding protein
MKRLALASLLAVLTLFIGVATRSAGAETVTVAVATNFSATLDALALEFQAETGHTIIAVSGSTGQLYAQISNRAPYDVFLAADQARPTRLAATPFAVDGTQFTYANGALALWSTRFEITPQTGANLLQSGDYRSLAIANPALAPYGLAAQASLESLALTQSVQDQIVRGENIGQTYLLIATGNADLGLVALSQLVTNAQIAPDSWWQIPATHHAPIRQDAILLQHGADNPAATAFLTFLISDTARGIIAAHGYTVTRP